MTDSDRTSIHEAMEQQSISISKAGIVATLQARCAIMAAANPMGGTYDSSMTFAENVDLTEPILSRFDILCVVRDVPDPDVDELLAKFVINSHIRHHPFFVNKQDDETEFTGTPSDDGIPSQRLEGDAEEMEVDGPKAKKIPQDLLQKYLIYAKRTCRPKLDDKHVDGDRVANLYSELRRESMVTGSIPITVRHVESIIRIAEAHAKIHLREYVNSEDINMSIRIVLESFIETQKFSVRKPMKAAFSRYLQYKQDTNELLLFILKNLVAEEGTYMGYRLGRIPKSVKVAEVDFVAKAKGMNIHSVSAFYYSDVFQKNGFVYDRQQKVISKRRGD